MSTTLKSIWQGVLRGDRKSQKQLYDYSNVELINICRRYLPDAASHLDAIQESYIKIFTKANSYSDSKGSLKSWMARIAVNECLQILRKQKRLVLLDLGSTSLEPQSQEDVVAQLSATEIYNEVEKLPVGYRTVFNLYVVEGYSHKEIGEMLTITPSSSRSQLTRAKVILKKAIKKKTNSMSYEKVG